MLLVGGCRFEMPAVMVIRRRCGPGSANQRIAWSSRLPRPAAGNRRAHLVDLTCHCLAEQPSRANEPAPPLSWTDPVPRGA